MSIQSEIDRIKTNVADSYAVISEMGGKLPAQRVSGNLAAAIAGIPQTKAVDQNPIGTIISFMGTVAPKGYLVCDGAEYLIADYPELAEFFQEQFGMSNYFGGDGETAFSVPDISGGPNSLCCIKAVLPEPVLDEYDTEDGWHVRKWADGYVEMIYVHIYSITSWIKWGTSEYVAYAIPSPVKYPVSLTVKYYEMAPIMESPNNYAANAAVSADNSSNEATNTYLHHAAYSSTSPALGNGKISVVVAGRWK